MLIKFALRFYKENKLIDEKTKFTQGMHILKNLIHVEVHSRAYIILKRFKEIALNKDFKGKAFAL